MSDNVAPKITAAHLDAQLSALKDAASMSLDPCLVAKYIAISDSRVRQLFLKKVEAGYPFHGVHCIERPGVPENKYVVFQFDCQPGTLCLVPPAFMVIVNVVDRYVVTIVDPYYPTIALNSSAGKCACDAGGSSHASSRATRSDCVSITIDDGKACLNIPYAGDVCISVPDSVPNGTVAEACIDTCSKFGILCGVEVSVRVLGVEVTSQSWGCC